MKERPIIFSASMVRAILSGAKTQTRRIITPQPVPCRGGHMSWCDRDRGWSFIGPPENFSRYCPYGQPGDRLWGRETFASFPSTGGLRFYRTGVIYHRPNDPRLLPEHPYREVVYRADGEDVTKEHPNGATSKWRSPVAMPRWASRITLEITDVRVERLQDISESDAIAEGCRPVRPEIVLDGLVARVGRSAVDEYRQLWQSIHGPESWSANPWVWVIEFKKLEQAGLYTEDDIDD